MMSKNRKERWFSESSLFLLWNGVWIGAVLGGLVWGFVSDWVLGGVGVLGIVLAVMAFKRPRVVVLSMIMMIGLTGYIVGQGSGPIPDPAERVYVEPEMTPLQVKLGEVIDAHLPFENAQLIKAMTLNLRGELSYDRKQQLAATGTSHIVAISGLHIGIIIMLISGVLYLSGIKRIVLLGVTTILIGGYVMMIGAPPSAVRASVMGIVLLTGFLAGRFYAPMHGIVLAASGMVLFDPMVLTSISFQLSFLAVLSILLFKEAVESFVRWLPKALRAMVSITIAVQILIIPLSAYYFESFSLLSIPSNIVILPLLPVLVGLSLIGAFVSLASLTLGMILLWPVWLLSSFVLWVIDILSTATAFMLTIPQPSLLTVLVYYFIAIGLFITSKRNPHAITGS